MDTENKITKGADYSKSQRQVIVEEIKRNLTDRYKKVAMIIALSARNLFIDGDYGEAEYILIAEEIKNLVNLGYIELDGDISDWRASEIRRKINMF